MDPRLQKKRFTILAIICLCIFIVHHFHLPKAPLPQAIQDNFPSASSMASQFPSEPHVKEKTPLFIGFSQNWLMLQQCVVSYLTAGWPASDIYIIDNTGTMFSNQREQLSINNPSYLNYSRLKGDLSVNVIITPARLSFSQLQNFYLFEATRRGWTYYFWSHADAVALSANIDGAERSLYMEAVADLRVGLQSNQWGIRFYAYDRLALVSVPAFEFINGWDTGIPYYLSDCDMYERLKMAGYQNPSPFIGHIFDVAMAVEDLAEFYRVDRVGSDRYKALEGKLVAMMRIKNSGNERNTWQQLQQGGEGEPYHMNPEGSKRTLAEMILFGRKIYKMKWGTGECQLQGHGWQADNAWRYRWIF